MDAGDLRMYADFYRDAPDGFYSADADNLILDANAAALLMLGYERGELVGRVRTSDLMPDEAARDRFRDLFAKYKATGHIEGVEMDVLRKDGTRLPVVLNAKAVYDGNGRYLFSRSVIRDNRAKKDLEGRLLQAAADWQATFDSLSHGLLVVDAAGVIRRVNAAAAAILGQPPDHLVGRDCRQAVSANRALEGICAAAAEASRQTGRRSARLHDKARGRVYLEQTTVLANGAEAGGRTIVSLVDVTELERSRLELQRGRDAFFNMLRDLDTSNRELQALSDSLIHAFVNVLEAKSPWTRGHSERVTAIAVAIGRALGLEPRALDDLQVAGLLHDIGKVGVYAQILEKPGPLTDLEMEMVRLHPAKGEEILRPVAQLAAVLPAVRHHHERFDGRGYPDRLAGEDIPLAARVLAVADAYDAMTSSRPYRQGMDRHQAIEELKRMSGSQFDPEVVDAYLGLPRAAAEALAFLRRRTAGDTN